MTHIAPPFGLCGYSHYNTSCLLCHYFFGCCTYILNLSFQKELGVFLGITDYSGVHLSLFNSEKLDDVVDVWGDGLYISIGLFIPEELAWKGLENYILNGTLWNQIKWIIPDDLPESGNFIC